MREERSLLYYLAVLRINLDRLNSTIRDFDLDEESRDALTGYYLKADEALRLAADNVTRACGADAILDAISDLMDLIKNKEQIYGDNI